VARGDDTPERLAMEVGEVSDGMDPVGTAADGRDGDAEGGGTPDAGSDEARQDGARDEEARERGDPDVHARAHSPRVWPWAVALVVALAGVVAFAMTRPTTPVVTAGTLFGEPSAPVPAAPAYQVARRWFEELPPDTVLTGVAIHDDLVVAHVRPVAREGDPQSSTVLAFDTVTGEPAWTTPLAWPGRLDGGRAEPEPPVVVLVDDGEPTALGDWATATTLTAGIVALEPQDGTVAWTRILPSPAEIRVFPERGRATIRTVDWARSGAARAEGSGDMVVELADGEDAFVAAGPLVAREGGWFSLDLEPEGGLRTWAVLAPDGTTELQLPSMSTPVMLDDLVVTTTPAAEPGAATPPTRVATTVTATTVAGDVAWETPLPGTDPVPATDVYVAVDDIGDGTLLAGAYRQSDNEVGRLQDYVTSRIFPDGRIEELDDRLLRDRALQLGVTTITVDGRAMLACAAEYGNPGTTCPASLALFDLDGTVAASVEDVVIVGGLTSGIALPGMATTAGLVVAEPDALRLRGWADLAPAWQVDLPAGFRAPVVATSDTGVVVGLQGPRPSLTWLS
jgi:outer membrane protein assembly factor BamB